MNASDKVWGKTIGGYELSVADPFHVGLNLNVSLRYDKPTNIGTETVTHTLIICKEDVRTLRDSLSEWLASEGDSQ